MHGDIRTTFVIEGSVWYQRVALKPKTSWVCGILSLLFGLHNKPLRYFRWLTQDNLCSSTHYHWHAIWKIFPIIFLFSVKHFSWCYEINYDRVIRLLLQYGLIILPGTFVLYGKYSNSNFHILKSVSNRLWRICYAQTLLGLLSI